MPTRIRRGTTNLTTRSVIAVHGQDAPSFLQGLTTRNVQALGDLSSPIPGLYAAFLNARGRVLHDVHIFPATWNEHYKNTLPNGLDPEQPGYIIEVDVKQRQQLKKYLERFRLRAKVKIWEPLEHEWEVWANWGEGWQGIAENQQHSNGLISESEIMGQRIIRPVEEILEGTKPRDDGTAKIESYELHRMLTGLAEGGELIQGEALPQESNLDALGAIDFRKGCYVGQELTIRTHHTGVVRKRILPVYLARTEEERLALSENIGKEVAPLISEDYTSAISRGAAIREPAKPQQQKRAVGKWLGGIGNIGLAVCKVADFSSYRNQQGELVTSPERPMEIDVGDGEHRFWVVARYPSWLRTQSEKSSRRGS
ncbi:MAG: ccr4 associated factor [Vezdaea aestivalis]|nr:MAG: ccr4 associated factor [Vezdaea aestivalis]